MQKKKTYDLFLSIGEACLCSSTLRASYLQYNSYPMDWVYGSDFMQRCKIVANKYENYINKEDLELSKSDKVLECTTYVNKTSNIRFNHDFYADIPFDKMYNKVREKYDRRIKRLLEKIETSDNVLLVYIEASTAEHVYTTDDELKKGLALIQKAFPNTKFDLLYIQYKKEDYKIKENQVSDNIRRLSYSYKLNEADEKDVTPDVHKLKQIFKQNYTINIPVKAMVKISVLRALKNFIPNKELKEKFRKKFHV